jgi:hypothetical protein
MRRAPSGVPAMRIVADTNTVLSLKPTSWSRATKICSICTSTTDTMQFLVRGVGIVAITLLLSACIPVPRRHYFAPIISGTVTEAGAPVEGAELYLSGEFTKKTGTVSTDSAGRFKIGPLRTWEASTWLLGDPLYGYSLLIRIRGSEYQGLTVGRVGYSPTELEITCDLAKPAIDGRVPQYCAPAGNTVHP